LSYRIRVSAAPWLRGGRGSSPRRTFFPFRTILYHRHTMD